mmetsp:Transcript_3082/g.11084  ORF Transcript_3082/g.11084 Transcript_3082/m.11084 type:complete len:221 (-) Transcript_3082:16-678(-)
MVRDRAYAKVLVSAAHCVRVGCHPFLLSGGVRFAGRTVPDLLNAKDFVKVGLRVCAILNLPFKILQGAHTSDLICFLDTLVGQQLLNSISFLATVEEDPTDVANRNGSSHKAHAVGDGLRVDLRHYVFGCNCPVRKGIGPQYRYQSQRGPLHCSVCPKNTLSARRPAARWHSRPLVRGWASLCSRDYACIDTCCPESFDWHDWCVGCASERARVSPPPPG